MDISPYFDGEGKGLESKFFVEQGLPFKGRTLPPICERTSSFLSWESRLPGIVKMIRDCDSDVVCLQEVQCSNASCAEMKSEPLIGGNTSDTHDKQKKAEVPKLIERIKGFLNSGFLVENPATLAQEHKKLCAVLNGKVQEPAMLSQTKKHLKAFYETPSPKNVKVVIVKKLKIPIFVDGKAVETRLKDPIPDIEQADDKRTSEEYQKLLKEKKALEKDKKVLEQCIAARDRSIEVLLHEKKWLQAIAVCDKPVEQRRHDLAHDANGFKQAKQQGSQHFLLVVVKAGFLQTGCQLEYVLPELPIYQQFKRAKITVLRIIDLNHYDDVKLRDAKDAKVKCVDSICVCGSDLESVALLQVLTEQLHSGA